MTEKKTEGAFWNNWKNSAIPATGTTISSPGGSARYPGWKGTATTTDVAVDPFVADLLQMNPQEIFQVSTLLKNAGYLRNASRKYNKTLGDAYSQASMEWSNESARTGRPNLTFRDFLLENVMAQAGGAAPQVPTRQVYNVTAAQIDADIEEIAMKRLGRSLQEEDRKAEWYNDLVKGVQKLYSQGVVSEPAKMVKNKKTGKMERVVTQTPGYSQEQVTQKITSAVEAADPESLARKERVDFTKWFFGRGGQD